MQENCLSGSIVEKYQKYDRYESSAYKNAIQDLQRKNLYPQNFQMPLTLQFELTSKCNVQCLHCYNDSGHNAIDLMNIQKWIEFSKYLVANGGIFECIISGGEPLLLGHGLFDIMDVLHDDGTFFLLITNGYLLDEDKIKHLKKYRYKWLQISIDGSDPAYHDKFRQKKGSWENAVKGAFMVTKAGIPLTIAHSVSPNNIEKIDDMCKLAYSLGASSIIISEIMPSGRVFANTDLMLNDKQRALMYQKVEENSALYKGRMVIQRSYDIHVQYEKHYGLPLHGAIIRPDGNIRLDCMLPFVIGNVLNDDFLEIWRRKTVILWENEKVKDYIFQVNTGKLRNYYDPDVIL